MRSFILSLLMASLIILVRISTLSAQEEIKSMDVHEKLLEEAKQWENSCTQISKLYELKEGEQIREITAEVLESSYVHESSKKSIIQSGRRFFVFWYPSDGLKVKGFISFVDHPEHRPLLILFRGGNRDWGLLNPGADLVTYTNYTVISSVYRGGISEGQDEFGGKDVDDVKNLIDFLPTLTRTLNISLDPSRTFMLGASRGGMQMFLLLARYPYLQDKVDKIVSLSGLLDMETQIQAREDMRQMFQDDFGLIEGVNEREWIDKRNPILTVPLIKKSLPILILQGSNDIRVGLQEGQNMVQKLKENGNRVTYIEVEGAEHVLYLLPNRMEMITTWLESE